MAINITNVNEKGSEGGAYLEPWKIHLVSFKEVVTENGKDKNGNPIHKFTFTFENDDEASHKETFFCPIVGEDDSKFERKKNDNGKEMPSGEEQFIVSLLHYIGVLGNEATVKFKNIYGKVDPTASVSNFEKFTGLINQIIMKYATGCKFQLKLVGRLDATSGRIYACLPNVVRLDKDGHVMVMGRAIAPEDGDKLTFSTYEMNQKKNLEERAAKISDSKGGADKVSDDLDGIDDTSGVEKDDMDIDIDNI